SGDPRDRLQHARADLGQRLAAGRRASGRGADPGQIRIALARADLVDGAALPLAERQLTELVNRRDGNSGPSQRDVRGVPRPAHRADIRGRHAIAVTQRVPERRGLRAAEIGEADVVGALKLSYLVPQRLAVTRQQEPHAGRSATSRARRRRASDSSRPIKASTSKIGGDAVRPVTARRASWARSTSLRPSSSVSARTTGSIVATVKSGAASSRSIISPRRRAPSGVKSFCAAFGSYDAGRSK